MIHSLVIHSPKFQAHTPRHRDPAVMAVCPRAGCPARWSVRPVVRRAFPYDGE